jgi:arylsulfatase A-like enzyme
LTRRQFLQSAAAAAAQGGKPNIVLLISDDLGYADLPLYGKSEIATPALAGLAKAGMRFTQAYATAPICVPSRMGINTGRYQQRFGIYDNMYDPREVKLFFTETLLAQHLKNLGYVTGLVGKWHLSGNRFPPNGPTPEQRGFDEWVGIEGGMSNYFPPARLYRNNVAFEAPEYLTDFFGKEAVRFIRQSQGRPFFLYVGFNAPHAPLEVPEGDRSGGEADSPDRRTYGGMVRALDRNIGRVLGALKELGLERSTLVAYVNDNGGAGNHTPPHSRNTARNAPLRGYKFELWEGGVRVPMILRWPGHIPAGGRFDRVVSTMDLAPTFVRAAGGELPSARPFDGVDLLPFLTGKNTAVPHAVLCWENRVWSGPRGKQRPVAGKYNRAVRKGAWKMVQLADEAEWQLFDLQADPGEQHDLAAEFPSVVAELREEYRRWREQMPNAV